jgi:hypothetical protein
LEEQPSKITIFLKWSTESGHRVKVVNYQNEVNNDNRQTNKTEVFRGL